MKITDKRVTNCVIAFDICLIAAILGAVIHVIAASPTPTPSVAPTERPRFKTNRIVDVPWPTIEPDKADPTKGSVLLKGNRLPLDSVPVPNGLELKGSELKFVPSAMEAWLLWRDSSGNLHLVRIDENIRLTVKEQ